MIDFQIHGIILLTKNVPGCNKGEVNAKGKRRGTFTRMMKRIRSIETKEEYRRKGLAVLKASDMEN